ncbi:MAG: hypothetical protein QM743_07960 [Chitinophagaceae bacterium]
MKTVKFGNGIDEAEALFLLQQTKGKAHPYGTEFLAGKARRGLKKKNFILCDEYFNAKPLTISSTHFLNLGQCCKI